MKNTIIASLTVGFCMLFVMQTAFAEEITDNHDIMTISRAIEKIKAQGYKNIQEVRFKNGFYDVKILTSVGSKEHLRLNPKTGAIEKLDKEAKILSMLEVIKKVQAAGYRDIYRISFDDGKYEVYAMDKSSDNVKLKVNAETGEISKAWF